MIYSKYTVEKLMETTLFNAEEAEQLIDFYDFNCEDISVDDVENDWTIYESYEDFIDDYLEDAIETNESFWEGHRITEESCSEDIADAVIDEAPRGYDFLNCNGSVLVRCDK